MKSIERDNERKRPKYIDGSRKLKNGDPKKLMVPAPIEEDINYEAQFQLRNI